MKAIPCVFNSCSMPTEFSKKGNVDVQILRSRLELVAAFGNDFRFKSQNNSLYQNFSGFKADEDYNSQNYLYFRPERKIYPFMMVYAQTNFRRKIDRRWFAGTGLTWQLIQHESVWLKTSASMVYEETRFNTLFYNEPYYNGIDNIRLWRPTLYLAGGTKLVQKTLGLNFQGFWQPGIAEVSNQRFSFDASVAYQLRKNISLNLHYLHTREQVVALSNVQNDHLLSAGLSLWFNQP